MRFKDNKTSIHVPCLEIEYERKSEIESKEQYEKWFLGSLMSNQLKVSGDFRRLTSLHNRITHNETNFNERYQSNRRIASQLDEFFPLQWLSEITVKLTKIKSTKLGVKTYKDQIGLYLGFIELYLAFRGLTLLDSILDEINSSFCLSISKNDIRYWKMKILRIFPDVKKQWIKIRARTHQLAILSAVVDIMNKEMLLEEYSKQEVFAIKRKALNIAKKFTVRPESKHMKKPEIWARAICLKSFKGIDPKSRVFPFNEMSEKAQKVIENKRWQLDRLLDD
ncbi:MAG: hypothetical protein ACW97X_02710 [Candidatus Hodarchaeales archaeon]|jgi:hypothetical protein